MQDFLSQQSKKNNGEMNLTLVSDNAITPTSSFEAIRSSKAQHGATRRRIAIETIDTQQETGYMFCEGEEYATPPVSSIFTHQMRDQHHHEQEYNEMEHASIFSDPRLLSPQWYGMSPHASAEEVLDFYQTPTRMTRRLSLDACYYSCSGKNASSTPPPPACDRSPQSIAITPEELNASGLKSSPRRRSSLDILRCRHPRKTLSTHSPACK
jgi:hypothetical protein